MMRPLTDKKNTNQIKTTSDNANMFDKYYKT